MGSWQGGIWQEKGSMLQGKIRNKGMEVDNNYLLDILLPLQQHQDNELGTAFNINLNVNLAITDRGSSTNADPGWDQLISGSQGSYKSHPDVHRLWARFFSPMGSPEQVISIPNDWTPFFIVMLLSPNHFEWAKSFLSSQAWKFLLSCASNSVSMSFAIPSKCPENVDLNCSLFPQAANCSVEDSYDNCPDS
ncbi:hypothetical protein SEVIR_8G217501v4 [Setaria viridis]